MFGSIIYRFINFEGTLSFVIKLFNLVNILVKIIWQKLVNSLNHFIWFVQCLIDIHEPLCLIEIVGLVTVTVITISWPKKIFSIVKQLSIKHLYSFIPEPPFM